MWEKAGDTAVWEKAGDTAVGERLAPRRRESVGLTRRIWLERLSTSNIDLSLRGRILFKHSTTRSGGGGRDGGGGGGVGSVRIGCRFR